MYWGIIVIRTGAIILASYIWSSNGQQSIEATPACAPRHSGRYLEMNISMLSIFNLVFKQLVSTTVWILDMGKGGGGIVILETINMSLPCNNSFRKSFSLSLKRLAHLDMFEPDLNVFQPDTAGVIFLHSDKTFLRFRAQDKFRCETEAPLNMFLTRCLSRVWVKSHLFE